MSQLSNCGLRSSRLLIGFTLALTLASSLAMGGQSSDDDAADAEPAASTTPTSDATSTADAAAIRELIEQLTDGDTQARRDAAWQLGVYGPRAAPAVEALIEAVQERDRQIANGALQSLAKIGPAANDAIAIVFEELDNRDDQRRYRAAFALGNIAKADDPVLKRGLSHSSARVRGATAAAMGWIQGDDAALAEPLVSRVVEDEAEVAEVASASLAKLGDAAIPVIQRHLEVPSVDDETVMRLASVLEQIGAPANRISPRLLELSLTRQSVDARAACLRALARLAPTDETTIARLESALTEAEPAVVQAAIGALIREPEVAAELLPALVERLDEDVETADLAATAIGRVGRAASTAIPELLRRITERNEQAIVNAIGQIGTEGIPQILEAVSEGAVTPDKAATVISMMGKPAEKRLVESMKADQAAQRAVSCLALGQLGLQTQALIDALEDPAPTVRASAARGLAATSQDATAATDRLVILANDEVGEVRAASLIALVSLQVPAKRLLSPIVAGMEDESVAVRIATATAIRGLEKLPTEVLEALAAGLSDDQEAVRRASAETLAQAGSQVETVIPALIQATSDPSSAVIEAAALALGNVDQLTPEGLAALAQLLTHDDPETKLAAIEALERTGPAAVGHGPALVELTHDESTTLRIASVRALAAIQPEQQQRLSVLVDALEDPDWTVRRKVMETIGEMEEEAVPAVPRLLELMQSSDDSEAATSALRRIGDAPPEAVPSLVEILENPRSDRRRRFYALFLLRKIGPEAQDALPTLKKLRDEAEGRSRDYLNRAIRDIEDK